jgi:hypothetical protein
MPLSEIPCPHCLKMGAQFIRSLPRKTYFCEECLKEFFDEADVLPERKPLGVPSTQP